MLLLTQRTLPSDAAVRLILKDVSPVIRGFCWFSSLVQFFVHNHFTQLQNPRFNQIFSSYFALLYNPRAGWWSPEVGRLECLHRATDPSAEFRQNLLRFPVISVISVIFITTAFGDIFSSVTFLNQWHQYCQRHQWFRQHVQGVPKKIANKILRTILGEHNDN